MVQSILFFILGFLCAGLLALLVAPAIWRRAVALTRKRMEASVPLALTDIQADKDRMRAEFAMSTRRLEMSVKSFREKAAEQIVDVTRHRAELKALTAERDQKREALAALETKAAELGANLEQVREQLQETSEKLARSEHAAEKQATELQKLARMYDDASFASSTRQIELVARESNIAKLADDVALLRSEAAEMQDRHDQAVTDNGALRTALEAEKKRTDDLEKRIQGMLTAMAERDEKLGAQERELVSLQEIIAGAESSTNVEAGAGHAAVRDARQELQAELGNAKSLMTTLSTERERLEDRLTALTRENRRLKEELGAQDRSLGDGGAEERRQGALLREEMNRLAAEVVTLTAALDGPDSPIARALSLSGKGVPGTEGGVPNSLADRVRALQKAASAK